MTAGFGLPGVVFKGSLADNILLIKKFGFCLEKKLSTTITEVYNNFTVLFAALTFRYPVNMMESNCRSPPIGNCLCDAREST